MSEYGMPRLEFVMTMEELVLKARPDVDLKDHGIRYAMDKLEELLYGLKPRAAEDYDEYIGSV